MTEIRFYQLSRSTLEQALPPLLQKVLEKGQRAVVMCGSPERVESLNQHLWSYEQGSFLPHGSATDGNAAEQPIWLTDKDENPNRAQVVILTEGTSTSNLHSYSLWCEMLNGYDEDHVVKARQRLVTYKTAGHIVSYWQQTSKSWEQVE